MTRTQGLFSVAGRAGALTLAVALAHSAPAAGGFVAIGGGGTEPSPAPDREVTVTTRATGQVDSVDRAVVIDRAGLANTTVHTAVGGHEGWIELQGWDWEVESGTLVFRGSAGTATWTVDASGRISSVGTNRTATAAILAEASDLVDQIAAWDASPGDYTVQSSDPERVDWDCELATLEVIVVCGGFDVVGCGVARNEQACECITGGSECDD